MNLTLVVVQAIFTRVSEEKIFFVSKNGYLKEFNSYTLINNLPIQLNYLPFLHYITFSVGKTKNSTVMQSTWKIKDNCQRIF